MFVLDMPHRLTKKQKRLLVGKYPFIFLKSAKIVTKLEYQIYLQLVEPECTNLSPKDPSMINSCLKDLCFFFFFWVAVLDRRYC